MQVVCKMKKAKNKSEKAIDSHQPTRGNILARTEFMETVLESLTHPFYVIDARDYTIQIANSAAHLADRTGAATCHALPHRKNEPCGSKDHPCPLEIVKKTRKPVTVEHIHFDKDGTTRNVEVHGFPIFDNDGNIVQMIEYCLDITDRKKVEEALQFEKDKLTNILDSMEDGVYIANDQYDIQYINPALEREFGPTHAQKCYDYFYDRMDKCPWCNSQDVFKGAIVRWEWHCPANGKTYDLLDTPIHNPDGSISKLEIFRDITERKQMEEDLRQHREHLEELVQARTTELTKANEQLLKEIERRKLLEKELLSIVEHERQRIGQELHDSIGQQLTGIAFMMEVLGEKLMAKSLTNELLYAERINSCVGLATEQTRNLAKGLHPIGLDKNALVSALRELASSTEQLFDVSCHLKCKNPVSINDVSVAMNLYRIAQEAVTNAIKHGNAKNILVSLVAERGHLRLTVENDGLNFPTKGGMRDGMGLRIMRHRAEVINSSLEICKGSNGGTIVTCDLSNEGHP